MVAAVLYPQDCLKNTFSRKALISSPSEKTPQSSNPNRPKRSRRPSNRGKRSPPGSQSHSPPTRFAAPNLPTTNLVMGQVKILRRGDLMSKAAPCPDLVSTDRLLAPAPESVATTNKVAALYAGSSACVASPPPSSVPFPAFFTKRSVSLSNVKAAMDLRKDP